jgi:hypothetical protein
VKKIIDHLREVADGADDQERDAWIGGHNVGFGVQFFKLNAMRGNHGDYLKVKNAIHIGCFNPIRARAMLDVMESANNLINAVEAQDMGLGLPSSLIKDNPGSYAQLLGAYRAACKALEELK